jgi:hypothetical protein
VTLFKVLLWLLVLAIVLRVLPFIIVLLLILPLLDF